MGNTILPGNRTLNIKKGMDYGLLFEIEIDDVVLDLTGATVQSTIRKGKDAISEVVAEFTVDISVGSVTGYDSDILLSLTDTETSGISRDSCFYDVLITDAQDTDTYYLEGQVNFLPRRTVKT